MYWVEFGGVFEFTDITHKVFGAGNDRVSFYMLDSQLSSPILKADDEAVTNPFNNFLPVMTSQVFYHWVCSV